MTTKFITFNPAFTWTPEIIAEITAKVKKWAEHAGLRNVILTEVEDNTWSDVKNQRFDITIMYNDQIGRLISQKLFMLRGEILDGPEFHHRFKEFY